MDALKGENGATPKRLDCPMIRRLSISITSYCVGGFCLHYISQKNDNCKIYTLEALA